MILLTRSPSVELLGEAPPRVLVEPHGVRGNSWEDVADLSAAFGLVLDLWQEIVMQAALGERTDGKWAAQQVAISAPRQNGKSQMIVARALAGVLLFGEQTVIISAHEQDTNRETFDKFLSLIEGSPALAARIPPGGIMNALNRERIKFSNGAVIKFKARTGSGGRGFSSDLLMLDEAQMLGAREWASINSTMSARENPQVWLLGTPPTVEDDGTVFTRVRKSALAGGTTTLAYLEWSATMQDDPASESTRARANPAWRTRINHDVVQGEFESYSVEQFALERLGIWLEGISAARLVDLDDWSGCAVTATQAPVEGVLAFAVKFSADGERVSCAVAMRPDEGPVHVESFGVVSMAEGTAGLVSWLSERWRKASKIFLDGKAGTGDLVQQLVAAGVSRRRLHVVSTDEAITAHAGMLRAIQEADVTHLAQPGLDAQVRVAGKRKVWNDGGWGWQAVTPDGDVTALDAVTLARHAAMTSKRRGGEGRTSSGNRTTSSGRVGVVM